MLNITEGKSNKNNATKNFFVVLFNCLIECKMNDDLNLFNRH